MCDTFYFNGMNKRFFMKNSDRSPNEPNLLRFYKREKHTEDLVHCTYIDIPQVKETYACLLVQPSWMYGAEMGINEFYVSIGNEAVFTKNNDQKEKRLIGMDYLRLALERSKTALDAAHLIILLLKEYGQGGNCGYDHEFYYDNSYLIMDKKETYILETVGKDYCLYKTNDSYNISNKLSLKKTYIESSKEYNNFEKENSDFFFTTFSMSKQRECHGRLLLNTLTPSIENAVEVLSHHRTINAPICGDVGSICMHKNAVGDHTTASMIVDYSYDEPTIYLTGSPSPCISIFKPYYFGQLSNMLFDKKDDSLNYYYKRMYLNRLVLGGIIDYSEFKYKIDKLNQYIFDEVSLKRNGNASIDELVLQANELIKEEESLINEYDSLINDLKNKKIKLKGVWNKLTLNLAKNPYSNKLEERLGK